MHTLQFAMLFGLCHLDVHALTTEPRVQTTVAGIAEGSGRDNYNSDVSGDDSSSGSGSDSGSGFDDRTSSFKGNIHVNQTKTGSTTTPGTSNHGNDSPEHYYVFHVHDTDTFTFSLCGDGTTYDSYLRLYDANFSQLDSNDDGCAALTSSSKALTSSSITQLLQPGTYYVLVEGYELESGSYSLSVWVAKTTPTRTTNSTFQGNIDVDETKTGDTTFPGISNRGNGSPEHYYMFNVSETSTFTFSLCSDGTKYDTYLRLYDGNFDELDANDDGCGSRSRITQSLQPGIYYVLVEGFGTRSGAYSLSIFIITQAPSYSPTPQLTFKGNINLNQTQSGNTALPGLSYRGNDSPEHYYAFNVDGADTFTFSLCSDGTEYDSYLRLYDANFSQLSSNDDGCGVKSSITQLLQPGTYYVLVEGYGLKTGSYALRIFVATLTPTPSPIIRSPTSAPSSNPTALQPTTSPTPKAADNNTFKGNIDVNQTQHGNTTLPGITELGNDSPEHYYAFNVVETCTFTFSLCDGGTTYDSYLRLYDVNFSQLSSNDDFCSRASSITQSLQPGSYYVLVEGYKVDSGAYSLRVTCNPPTPTPAAPTTHPGTPQTKSTASPTDSVSSSPTSTPTLKLSKPLSMNEAYVAIIIKLNAEYIEVVVDVGDFVDKLTEALFKLVQQAAANLGIILEDSSDVSITFSEGSIVATVVFLESDSSVAGHVNTPNATAIAALIVESTSSFVVVNNQRYDIFGANAVTIMPSNHVLPTASHDDPHRYSIAIGVGVGMAVLVCVVILITGVFFKKHQHGQPGEQKKAKKNAVGPTPARLEVSPTDEPNEANVQHAWTSEANEPNFAQNETSNPNNQQCPESQT
eukprot:m.38328 g.38328  ORF g.38328 m.38328 type:complete len:858 (+) comp17893_c0_seq1:193-2766(+)